jgi:uncharacterized membrane protein
MIFTAPLALLLLLVLIPIIYWGLPRTRFRRTRDSASLILRCLLVTLVVLALAGTQIVRAADRLAVVFLVDASDSMSAPAREAQIAYLRDALARMTPDDEAAVVVFGSNALVERALSAVRELPNLRSAPVTSNTDMAEALRIGLGLFPADSARRIVILSDGVQTVGDALAVARRAAATGVEISYVPFSRSDAPEVQVTDVRAPEEVNAGQEFDLAFTVRAEAVTEATLTVLAGGEVLSRGDVTLSAGDNNYTLTLEAGAAGFRDFQVRVDPVGGDAFYQNNQLAAFSQVVGPPRVLIVTTEAAEAQYVAAALEQVGISVEITAPNALPIGIAPLAEYQSVILANVPATTLTNRRMETLAAYVRDLGGGLVVIGGPNSYAPGGYFQTPLEEALPVEMQIRDQQRLPQLTIVYVIDRSGSMSAISASGVENIELAKEAMIRSIDFLQATDRAGVVSFDSAASWIAEVQPVFDRIGLQNLIGTLRASGGTDIEAGYTLAAESLETDPSTRKHIILLTDGGSDPGQLVATSGQLFQLNDVTTSVISIGASPPFLAEMAARGGGNFHEVLSVEQIPTIFASETVLATRSYIIEETPFVPNLTANSPIMQGITAAPPLLGYVATTARQTAQVILRTPDAFADPILAAWQYGLGRSVAFTSDATARWGGNWVDWADFARFWGQAVRWTITETAENNVEARIVMEGEQARIIVDARDADGGFLNGLVLQASVVDPELGAQLITLQQVAPGRYEARYTPGAEGAYFVRLTGEGEAITVNQTSGWVMSYSPEYDTRIADDGDVLLGDMALLTGGRSLVDDVGAVFAHNLQAAPTFTPLAPWLLLVAALLLPLDIALRRLLITRSDLARLRGALFPARVAAETAPRMTTLMEAKQRAQEKVTSPPDPLSVYREGEAARATGATIAALRGRKEGERTAPPDPLKESVGTGAAPSATQSPKPIVTSETDAARRVPTSSSRAEDDVPPAAPAPKGDGSTASRLLEKRRGREGR